MALRTVGVRLVAEIGSFQSNLKQAAQSTRDFKGELDKAAQNNNLDKITTAAGGLGLGLAGVAVGAVKLAADFDKAMSGVAAATHAPASEIAQLRAAALQAGKDTQYSATQAADGITQLSKAGVATADILGGGLKGALSLAAAGQIDVGQAAETAASAMTQFKLKGDQVPHVADLLAAAAGKAQGSVGDMSYALDQSGLVAAQFGLSIEDTTGALAEFANAGLIGSDAGTSLKTMLLALASPTTQTKAAMRDLGISFYDAQGRFIGLDGVAQVLQSRLKGLTDQQRQATLAQIFGTDAIRAASILYADGSAGVQKWKTAVDDAGYAGKTAADLTNNLAGDLERLKGSLETLAIQSGGGAAGGLRILTKGANEAVDAFSDLPHWVQSSITVLSGVGGASLLAAAGFLKARGTAKDLMDELRDMGPRGAKAAEGLGKIGGYATKIGLVGTAVGVVGFGMKAFSDWVNHFSAPTVRDIDKMTEALRQFASTGKVTGELAKTFGENMSGLTRDLDSIRKAQGELQKLHDIANGPAGTQGEGRALAALGGQIKDLSAQANTDLGALDQALANLVSNGAVTAAKTAFNDFARSTGLSLAQLPRYAAAAQGAAVANTGLAQGFGDARANADTMNKSLESAVQAGQKLTDIWNQLHGALLSTDQANLATAQAIDAVKASFQANKKAIDGNSEAALKNRIAVGEAAQAASKAAQAKYAETGSVADASRLYDTYIGQLRKTLTQSGLTKAEVDRLISAYATMPDSVATNVSAPGATAAKKQIDDAHAAAKQLAGQYEVALNVTGQGNVEAELRKLSSMQQALKSANTLARLEGDRGFAKGGWTGPGSKYEPAGIVHRDEFVIQKESRQKIEQARPGLLDSMNAGYVPGYAGGGRVWPFPVNVADTKIPDPMIAAPGGSGGPGYRWMEAVVRQAFPGLNPTSDYRPHSITLSGNLSYHSLGRAVDFPPSRALAEWINLNFGSATKELITPWNDLNIKNGSRHAYSGEVYDQHAGIGRWAGNAHDHWAMANGGVITEPVFGIGASGDTYSFGEGYRPERVTPMWQTGGTAGGGVSIGSINITAPVGSHPREIGAAVVQSIGAYLQGGGELRINGQKVL